MGGELGNARAPADSLLSTRHIKSGNNGNIEGGGGGGTHLSLALLAI